MADISKTEGIRELTIKETTEVAGASGSYNSTGGHPLLSLLDHVLDHAPGPAAAHLDAFIDSLTHKNVSDIRAKHDIALVGRLDNGLGFYRFSYTGSAKAYVGVMAHEVEEIMPTAVVCGSDGYLRVDYDMLGFRLQTWEEWVASGQEIPTTRH